MSNSMTKLFAAGLVFLSMSSAFAGKDAGAGNGGDTCEMRINEIRTDIAKWIQQGGAAGLRLPNEISLAQYDRGMLSEMKVATVSCQEKAIFIGNAEKTCMNFVDAKGRHRVICNVKRFMNETSESDQYVLIHHEYAGLAGFEVNDKESSNYALSDQLSGYLETVEIKKLSLHPVQSSPNAAEQRIDTLLLIFEDVSHNYCESLSGFGGPECAKVVDAEYTFFEGLLKSGHAVETSVSRLSELSTAMCQAQRVVTFDPIERYIFPNCKAGVDAKIKLIDALASRNLTSFDILDEDFQQKAKDYCESSIYGRGNQHELCARYEQSFDRIAKEFKELLKSR